MPYIAIWEVRKFLDENSNFTMGSSTDEELLKFKLCAEECAMEMSRWQRNLTYNQSVIQYCNFLKDSWFHWLYYEMWQRSTEIHRFKFILQSYVIPILIAWSLLQLIILSVLLICFTHLRKINAFWYFFLAYCVASGTELVIISVLVKVVSKNLPKSKVLCRGEQFASSTLTAVPNWMLAEALFNETLKCIKCSCLGPVDALGAKIIIICTIAAAVVLNSHSLWLYGMEPYDRTCTIGSDEAFFLIGYPIYRKLIEEVIPMVAIIACVILLIYSQCMQTGENRHQSKTPLCLGVNYIVTNIPTIILWLINSSYKRVSLFRPFFEVKLDFFMTNIIEFFNEQTNIFILPIALASSSLFRKTTIKYFQKLSKRARELIKPDGQRGIALPDINIREHGEPNKPLVSIIEA